jgi:TPR repeat protein
MPVEPCLSNRLTMGGAIVAVLLSASSAFAGALENGEAAYNRNDWTTAMRLLRPVAEGGDVKAEHLVAMMYLWGRGVAADPAEAFRWYRKAAEQGDADAEAEVGAVYWGGWQPDSPVQRDTSQALKWFRKAADQGQEEAQFALGIMYERGAEGVPPDYALAHMWLNLAAAQSAGLAKVSLDELAAKMTPDQIAEARRLAREWKPTK